LNRPRTFATLHKPGEEKVPFFFLRLDAAGNISKRLDGAGFPFAGHGGACLWNVHEVFAAPGRIATQWLELPDGQRFFSIARTVGGAGAGGGHACCARWRWAARPNTRRASSMRRGLIRAGQRPRPSAFRAACATAPPAPPARCPPSGAR
jgi:hypothetical protein